MKRFVFEFDGNCALDEYEFFAGRMPHPEVINLEDVGDELDGVSVDTLMNDWNMADAVTVTMTDIETGAIWENNGRSWRLTNENEVKFGRKLLPGEQPLF